jgi:hypothetical protein
MANAQAVGWSVRESLCAVIRVERVARVSVSRSEPDLDEVPQEAAGTGSVEPPPQRAHVQLRRGRAGGGGEREGAGRRQDRGRKSPWKVRSTKKLDRLI